MTNISKTILFFGTEDFSAHTLTALINRGFSIGAIITKPDTRRGRRSSHTQPRVKTIGQAHGIPVWQPTRLRDIADDIQRFDNPIGVLVSYGKIIPQSIIDLFNPGIINLHPSLLPQYRGPSPIESAILAGDTQTGISIMQLSAQMDAGPVYLQEHITLSGRETSPELYDKLGTRGAELLSETLPRIIEGTFVVEFGARLAAAQDEDTATYCQLIKKSDGLNDWTKPAQDIEREIRAYLGWPGSRASIGQLDVIVTAAHVVSSPGLTPGEYTVFGDAIIFGTTHNALCIDRLKPIGKKEMPVQAFLSGYKAIV